MRKFDFAPTGGKTPEICGPHYFALCALWRHRNATPPLAGIDPLLGEALGHQPHEVPRRQGPAGGGPLLRSPTRSESKNILKRGSLPFAQCAKNGGLSPKSQINDVPGVIRC